MRELHINCAPFTARPNVYMEYICKNILAVDYYEPISTFFGDWVWEYNPTDEQRTKVRDFLKSLYEDGKIRYGAW